MERELPISKKIQEEQLALKAHIKSLQDELADVEQRTSAFETMILSHISDLLIEERELSLLYKQLKQAKKAKRLEQKRRGKNYKHSTELQTTTPKVEIKETPEDEKEKKRLYREAILQVHPDKFSMNPDGEDLATEVTSKLIDIYKNGDLETLKNYHAHIFSGNAMSEFVDLSTVNQIYKEKDTYLQVEIEQLRKLLENAKAKHTYKVLTEYKNPITFVDELKEYYNDRLQKLRKRTRKTVGN